LEKSSSNPQIRKETGYPQPQAVSFFSANAFLSCEERKGLLKARAVPGCATPTQLANKLAI